MTFRLPHLFAAAALHVLLIGLLFSGLQCTVKPVRPPVISAVLLDPSRQQAADQKRAERKRAEEQKQREAEAERRKQDELKKQQVLAQRQAAEADKKKKADEARRQKQIADQKKLADQKKAAEQKKADDAARKKLELEAQREREASVKRDAEERKRIADAMAAEETQREAAREQAARAASEREVKQAQWADVLSRHIARNWVRPPSTAEDFQCQLHLQLLPDGSVTNARIEKSCGSAQLDKSVEDAVYRASPLPKPEDPSVFDRDLTIIFEP